MKHNIEFMTCNNCGAHIYPPTEVSDVGIDDYEDVFQIFSEVYDKMGFLSSFKPSTQNL